MSSHVGRTKFGSLIAGGTPVFRAGLTAFFTSFDVVNGVIGRFSIAEGLEGDWLLSEAMDSDFDVEDLTGISRGSDRATSELRAVA